MDPTVVTAECDSFSSVESGAALKSAPKNSCKENTSSGGLTREIIVNCYQFWRNKQPERTEEETCTFVADMLGVRTQAVLEARKKAEASCAKPSRSSRKRR